ncbi:MAG: hypothetical protein KDC90_16470, partial [Ignavibacteriae bacterium]|nr:hypothetical protein [Ignavibacteriota bacterium]
MKDIISIKNAKTVLIATPDMLKLDTICSSIVLAQMLQSQSKEVTILTNIKTYEENYSEDIRSENTKLLDRVESNKYLAKLPVNKEIKDVQLVRNEDEYEVVVETFKGNLNDQGLIFKRMNLHFDLLILMGFDKPSSNKEIENNLGKTFT